MAKIGDEIRDFVKRSYADEHMDPRELLALADRVDAEMVELPRDIDGVPINVGDTVYLDDGEKAEVTRIGIGMIKGSIYTIVYGDHFSLTPGHITHTRPDSWERIAYELEEWSESNRINGSGEVFYRAGDLADRIRKLVKKEGEHGAD